VTTVAHRVELITDVILFYCHENGPSAYCILVIFWLNNATT